MNEDIHVLRGKIIQDFLSTYAALFSGFYARPAILKSKKALVGHVGSMGRNLKQRLFSLVWLFINHTGLSMVSNSRCGYQPILTVVKSKFYKYRKQLLEKDRIRHIRYMSMETYIIF